MDLVNPGDGGVSLPGIAGGASEGAVQGIGEVRSLEITGRTPVVFVAGLGQITIFSSGTPARDGSDLLRFVAEAVKILSPVRLGLFFGSVSAASLCGLVYNRSTVGTATGYDPSPILAGIDTGVVRPEVFVVVAVVLAVVSAAHKKGLGCLIPTLVFACRASSMGSV